MLDELFEFLSKVVNVLVSLINVLSYFLVLDGNYFDLIDLCFDLKSLLLILRHLVCQSVLLVEELVPSEVLLVMVFVDLAGDALEPLLQHLLDGCVDHAHFLPFARVRQLVSKVKELVELLPGVLNRNVLALSCLILDLLFSTLGLQDLSLQLGVLVSDLTYVILILGNFSMHLRYSILNVYLLAAFLDVLLKLHVFLMSNISHVL